MVCSLYRFESLNFSHSDIQEQNPEDFANDFPQIGKKYSQQAPTQESPQQLSHPPTRSTKNQQNIVETSFQSDFLHEHAKALELKLQNFIESISQSSQKIQKSSLKSKILKSNCPFIQDSLQVLRSPACELKIQQKIQFEQDLKHEKKLKRFLDLICQKLVSQISGEFLVIANYVWVQYLKVVNVRMDQKNLQLWGQNLAVNKFNLYKQFLLKTELTTYQDDPQSAFPNFDQIIRELMKYLFVTVVLVIEQCFENPFYNDNNKSKSNFNFKRQFSTFNFITLSQFDSQEQCSFAKKKIHN